MKIADDTHAAMAKIVDESAALAAGHFRNSPSRGADGVTKTSEFSLSFLDGRRIAASAATLSDFVRNLRGYGKSYRSGFVSLAIMEYYRRWDGPTRAASSSLR